MARAKVAVTLDAETLEKLDQLVRRKKFPSRSQAIQQAVCHKLERAKQRPKMLLPPEEVPVEVRIDQLLAMLSETEACGFEDLFAKDDTRGEMITTFLALLEMIRLKLIRVFQTAAFGPIRVYKRARPADAPMPIGDPETKNE